MVFTNTGSSSDIDSMSLQNAEIKKCKYCGGKIKWLPSPDGALREDGTPKSSPYNAYPPFERHRCVQFQSQAQKYKSMPNAQKVKGTPCKYGCGAMIMFSADQRTDKGKWIPLEMDGTTTHQCPVKQQQYLQQQQKQQQQQPSSQQDDYGQEYDNGQQQQQGDIDFYKK